MRPTGGWRMHGAVVVIALALGCAGGWSVDAAAEEEPAIVEQDLPPAAEHGAPGEASGGWDEPAAGHGTTTTTTTTTSTAEAHGTSDGAADKVEGSMDRAGDATKGGIEKAGAATGKALDKAITKTGEGIGYVIDKTGQGLKNAGEALSGE